GIEFVRKEWKTGRRLWHLSVTSPREPFDMHGSWTSEPREKPEGPSGSIEAPVRPRKRRRTWILAVVALVAVVAVLVGIKAGQIGVMIKAGKSFAIPPESVTSARVEAMQWESARSAVGTLVAVRAVTVASELPGLVRKIGFDSGAFVRKGEVM